MLNLNDPSQAYAYLMQQVYVPAFFDKLASYGISPQNESEAQQLLEIGAHMWQLRQAQAASASQGREEFLKSANVGLQRILENIYGPSAAVKLAAASEQWLDHVAGQIAADPSIQQSVLTCQAALANAMGLQ
jgi:hypothetical protein